MNSENNIGRSRDTLDFNKLYIVVRNNWVWLALIFVVINTLAWLYIRYTKNIYQSESELKLEISDEASDLGIRNVMEDENVKLINSQIEVIQSELFLSHVLNKIDLSVSYYSIGRVLNDELFVHAPFKVEVHHAGKAYYDQPIYYEEQDASGYIIRLGSPQKAYPGKFGEPLSLPDCQITITRNTDFVPGEEVGYFFQLNSKHVLLQDLKSRLSAEPINFNANTLRLTYTDFNAHKAYSLLSLIDSVYIAYSYAQKNLANKQKLDWVNHELRVIEEKMQGYENYFENFTLQNKTNNLDADLNKTITAINFLDSQRYELTQKIQRVERLQNELSQGTFSSSLSYRYVLPEGVIRNLEELQTLELSLRKMGLSYKESTFAFREKQKEIENRRAKTIASLAEIKSDWMDQLNALNTSKRQLENEFASLPDKNTQFTKNLRFYKLNEQFYLMLMKSKSEFEIAQAGSTPDFKILSPASFPTSPIAPNKTLIQGAGLMVSLVLIFLFGGIAYLLNNKVSTLSEIEQATALPVLGVVPDARSGLQNGLHVLSYPRSMVSEAMRTLRTNLDFFGMQSSPKVIAITSTVSGEGKSFIARNLGGVISLSRKRTILVDLDMRKAKVFLPKDHNELRGVSTVLIRKHGWKDCVQTTELEHFDYLPSGPPPPNPSELLLNGEFEALLNELKQNYDYILLDTPPVGLVTDGIMAMKRADISVYIFRANYSKKDFLNTFQRIVKINKLSNITMLLNALKAPDHKGYGYGYYEEPVKKKWFTKLLKT